MRNAQFQADAARLSGQWGIHFSDMAMDWLPGEFRNDFPGAVDAQPAMVTTANANTFWWLTAYVDPEVVTILQAPNKGAKICGEVKRGDWLTRTAIFQTVEHTGEVAAYGDYNTNGRADVNFNFPERDSFLFQTIIEYGDKEVAQAGEAKLQLVSEKQKGAALAVEKFRDFTYHFGVSGQRTYGLLNDPSLSAALTPATKTAGGVKWINAGVINATANEVYADVQTMVTQLITQSKGRIEMDSAMTLVMSPEMTVALTITNSFGVSVADLLKKNYPGIKVETSPRYATAAGQLVQLIADKFEGADTAYCAFNEKLRQHQLIPALSSKMQKVTGGTWGAIIRYPIAIGQMLGV